MTKHKRKAAARKPRAKTPATGRASTKQAGVIALLERADGATIQEIG